MAKEDVSVRASARLLDDARRAEVISLVEQAFAEAGRKKGKPQTAMHLGVLNNRLLYMTNRTFSPSLYGASSLKALLLMLGPRVVVRNDGGAHPVVELVDAAATPVVPSQLTSPTPPQGRIREDLWRAFVDYASGVDYVWDAVAGCAVPKSTDRPGEKIPTITFKELQGWRAEFLRTHRDQMSTAEYSLALRWLEQGLSAHQLPQSLQGGWKRSMTARVRGRIDTFFASLAQDPHAPDRGAYEALQEDYAAARQKGENFVAGEILASGLSQVPDEEVATVLASNHKVNDFVMKVAKEKGYEGDRLSGAIEYLEDKFPVPQDNVWKGTDSGISARSHHLDDLAHHPTPRASASVRSLRCTRILTSCSPPGAISNAPAGSSNAMLPPNGSSFLQRSATS